MGITRIFENSGEKNCENWLENEFTSFAENAITSIFAKGWDSLGFSKKMVKKTAKIGQKMNSVSYLECSRAVKVFFSQAVKSGSTRHHTSTSHTRLLFALLSISTSPTHLRKNPLSLFHDLPTFPSQPISDQTF